VSTAGLDAFVTRLKQKLFHDADIKFRKRERISVKRVTIKTKDFRANRVFKMFRGGHSSVNDVIYVTWRAHFNGLETETKRSLTDGSAHSHHALIADLLKSVSSWIFSNELSSSDRFRHGYMTWSRLQYSFTVKEFLFRREGILFHTCNSVLITLSTQLSTDNRCNLQHCYFTLAVSNAASMRPFRVPVPP